MDEYNSNTRPQEANERIRKARDEHLKAALNDWVEEQEDDVHWKGNSIYSRDKVMYKYKGAHNKLTNALNAGDAEEQYQPLSQAVDYLESIEKEVQTTHSDYYGDWRNAIDLLIPAAEAVENVVDTPQTDDDVETLDGSGRLISERLIGLLK